MEESENRSNVSGLGLNNLRSSISMWGERWFLSTNAKDIGSLYLIFALFSGLLGAMDRSKSNVIVLL